MNEDVIGDGRGDFRVGAPSVPREFLPRGDFKPGACYFSAINMIVCLLKDESTKVDLLPWCIPNVFETLSDSEGEIVGLQLFVDRAVPREGQTLQQWIDELGEELHGYHQSSISKMTPGIWDHFKDLEIRFAQQ